MFQPGVAATHSQGAARAATGVGPDLLRRVRQEESGSTCSDDRRGYGAHGGNGDP